jgi:hypothetical protein
VRSPRTWDRCGGATGAGVPRPVHPKSQTQRSATANPSTDGTAASHRQRDAPAISTLKPSHRGSSQNHNAKNATPTAGEATAVSQRLPFPAAGALVDCASIIVGVPMPQSTATRALAGLDAVSLLVTISPSLLTLHHVDQTLSARQLGTAL